MQNSPFKDNRREWWVVSGLILIISALSYLLLANKFGFYFDDWYLAYAGAVRGSAQYTSIFAIDRPFRAFLVGPVFTWFGLRAPLYSYLSYALRAAGAFGFYWLLRLVWPGQKRFGVLLAGMFAIYPGWTDQPAAFDYQSHLLSFALMVFSLALTVKAVQARSTWERLIATALALVTQVTGLLLMEYYIGMEGLRLVFIVYLLSGRDLKTLLQPGRWARLGRILLSWLPGLAGAGGFFFWRAFIFQSARAATDLNGIFTGLLESPLRRGLWAALNLFRDFFNVTLLAWFVPLQNTAYSLELRESLEAVLVGLACAGLAWASMVWLERQPGTPGADLSRDGQRDGIDMFWIGCLGVLLPLVPIVIGDRHVVFMTFTRFTLPSSVGVVLLIGGLLAAYTRGWLRTAVPVLLIGLACIFHYSNAVRYAETWASMRSFWWQVSWRAPQIEEGSVLAAEYASVGIPEDYYVWGPANLIYYPEAHEKDGLLYTPIGAVVLNTNSVLDITLQREQSDRERRSLLSPQNLDRVLVLSMPTTGSCVEILDGKAVELTERARDRIFRIAPYSDIDLIQTGAAPHTPPAELFGAEPEHVWCYYYQKASLARQQGDWEEVVRLADELQKKNLRPAEWVEWMPFAQGYAYLGRYADVDQLSVLIGGVPFLRSQACQRFTEDAYGYSQQYPEGQKYLQDKFCH
jgi:hypothetical protein